MLTKITIQSNVWQAFNLSGTFRNNRNVYLMIQNTENNTIVPTADGVMIKPYESFVIPDDATQYWIKYVSGSGEIIADPTLKFSVAVGGGSSSVEIIDSGVGVFAGTGEYIEITLNVDNGDAFQAIITPKGNESEALTLGSWSVEYIDTDKFRVYNTGSDGMEFDWKAVIN